jgi:FkbM family methyltransferase
MMAWLKQQQQDKKVATAVNPTATTSIAFAGEKPWSAQANQQDIYYCYRLLLQREPDEGGWSFWNKYINDHQVSVQHLVDHFLHSEEFLHLQNQLHQPYLVELDEFKIYVRQGDYFLGASIARNRMYEPHVTRELLTVLRPGQVFVDIGANAGYFVCMAAARVGPTGKVIAFEPNPDNCELLTLSVEANNFKNVELHPYAVAAKEATLGLVAGHNDSNGRLLSPTETAPAANTQYVKAIVLDSYLADRPKIDMIKMDIEGAEPQALAGMGKLIEKHRPVIFTEFNPDVIEMTSQTSGEAYLDQLYAHRYSLFVLELNNRSAAPLSKAEIMNIFRQGGERHLDLVGYPQ